MITEKEVLEEVHRIVIAELRSVVAGKLDTLISLHFDRYIGEVVVEKMKAMVASARREGADELRIQVANEIMRAIGTKSP